MSHLGASSRSKDRVEREQVMDAMRGAADSVRGTKHSASTATLFNNVTRAAQEAVRRAASRPPPPPPPPATPPPATPTTGGVSEGPTPVVVEYVEDSEAEIVVVPRTEAPAAEPEPPPTPLPPTPPPAPTT